MEWKWERNPRIDVAETQMLSFSDDPNTITTFPSDHWTGWTYMVMSESYDWVNIYSEKSFPLIEPSTCEIPLCPYENPHNTHSTESTTIYSYQGLLLANLTVKRKILLSFLERMPKVVNVTHASNLQAVLEPC